MRYRTSLLAWWLLSAAACLDPERIVVASNQDASAQSYLPGCLTCMSSDSNPTCRDVVAKCRGAAACDTALTCVFNSCVGHDFQSFLSCVNACVKDANLLGDVEGSEYGIGLYQCFTAPCRAACIAEPDAGAL